MSEFMGGWKRSCYCAELSSADNGKNVTLMGWCNYRRPLGGLIFIVLRDRTGLIQTVFDQSVLSSEDFEKASTIRSEFVIAVKGKVSLRDENMINPKMKTGEIEVFVNEFKILSASETTPFEISDDTNASELVRLKYRYLDLRRPIMQSNLMMRNKIAHIARNYFADNGFVEIETPLLTGSTPEGARDYLVPSRIRNGSFYALPQSPQLFKQMLMVSGFDRYIQLARCFRDEDLRADRQPDFTQIDMELSFVEAEDVMTVNEGFLKRVFKECLDIDIQLPLPRMKWIDAMNRYGSDKPDTRFGLELNDISDCVRDCDFAVFTSAIAAGGSVRCINIKDGSSKFSRKEIDALGEFVKTYKAKGLAWMNYKADGIQSPILKFLNEDTVNAISSKTSFEKGDLLLIVADKNSIVWASLGALRLKIGEKLGLIDPKKFNLLWVTEFPQFEWSDEENRFMAMHHPFTMPMEEDIDKLETDPGAVRAKAYDIVLNGTEIGGGSIRIHSSELQKRMFKALGFTEEQAQQRFGFLLEAFKYGTPPHGGLAYGLDRVAMIICGASSIRDVIAFPKVQNASDPLTNAPYPVDEKQLKELGISFVIDNN